MNWFDRIVPSRIKTSHKKQMPDGIWTKCPSCEATLYIAELKLNLNVCPKCDFHIKIGARQRLDWFLDENSTTEHDEALEAVDALKFKDSKRYKDRIATMQKKTSENDAFITMSGTLKGMPLTAGAFEFGFMGGSMGSVVGEKITRGIEKAAADGTPYVCFSASGGARMQEGLASLMQMAKTSSALNKLAEKRLPYISVLTDPTMGGVSASFAMLGDVIIAEPNALIGFAGPRVIEQTVREVLPEGFQRSEFLLEKGAIDKIVDRREMRDVVHDLLASMMFTHGYRATEMEASNKTALDNVDSAADSSDSSTVEPSKKAPLAEVDDLQVVKQTDAQTEQPDNVTKPE